MFEAPVRWSMGVEIGTTRTIIEITTDSGETGIGETYGGLETVSKVNGAKRLLVGEDPYLLGRIFSKFENYFRIPYETSFPPHVYAGIEMALWDLNGKMLERPVSDLLGGSYTSEVEVWGYPFWRYKSKDGKGGESTPEALTAHCRQLVDRYGLHGLKVKGGVLPPRTELEAMRALRREFGEDFALRFDPNAAWSVETSVTILRQMEELNLEYVEDPTWGIQGMSFVRKSIRVPLATNMCVIYFDQIPHAVQSGAVDVIMSDIHFWGGFQLMKKLKNVCETFMLGLSMHSDRELGISTAAMLHFAASTPYMKHAMDSHYHHQVDDIITEPHLYRNGVMKVPRGPGLGVELDRKKVERYNAMYREMGDVDEFSDPYRPGWIGSLPLW